jgi:S1-C subfamily serine protease
MFAIEGESLYILSDDGKERQTRIMKKISRGEDKDAGASAQIVTPAPPEETKALPSPQVNAPTAVVASEINACKYLSVTDFSNDPYGIANEFRTQARERGFVVALSGSDIPVSDQLKMCTMRGSWSSVGPRGHVDMQVLDASGSLIAEAAAGVTARTTVKRAVRAIVERVYSQLGYTGFNEDVYRLRLQREYPPRPRRIISEEGIKKSERQSSIEGIWTDTEDQYRLGIVPSSEGSGADYVAVVLRSNSALWQPGEIKAEIRSTASPDVFTCTYYMRNKKAAGTTLILERDSLLRGSPINTPAGPFNLLLVRVWPKVTAETATESTVKGAVTGTGFLLNHNGLIATNWHVVDDAKSISVTFTDWNGNVSAQVVVRDKTNDLAILRVLDSTKMETTCRELPFQLASANGVTLGERVSTVGYPLTPMLGSNPKFSEGVVSSKSGVQDDPRWLQISAQVQPGSSGSPLFDSDGFVIGIVVATLDAGKAFQAASAIPQNVNFAIKADYLLSLLAMLPGESPASRTTAFSPENASRCVALIRAW